MVFTQTAIAAATAVADEVTKGAPDKGAALERIASIDIATSRIGLQQTGTDREKWAPATRDSADHSMPYITARAMFDGNISNDSYAPAKLKEPRILAFMQKITVAGRSGLHRAGRRRRADAHHRDFGGRAARQPGGQRHSRLCRQTDAKAGHRPQIPRQYRKALATRKNRRRSAIALGA